MLLLKFTILISFLPLIPSLFSEASAVALAPKERIISELENYGSSLKYNPLKLNVIVDQVGAQHPKFDVQTWKEAIKLLGEESALGFNILKSIVENTGRIQSPHGVLSTEKEAMLYTLRALLRRKLRQTKNRLPWTFLLGQTQFYLGQPDNFYLKHYLKNGTDAEKLGLAREMLAQIKP